MRGGAPPNVAIAGFVLPEILVPKQEDHAALVSVMRDPQVQRGPDDLDVSSFDDVCLGSNRLSHYRPLEGGAHAR
jgi:hypothetical protein